MSGRFSVTTSDLQSAGHSFQGVRGELSCGQARGAGDLGSGTLEGAMGALAGRLEMVAAALDEAAGATARNLGARAESYSTADQSFPEETGR